jgi:hypothetical protein
LEWLQVESALLSVLVSWLTALCEKKQNKECENMFNKLCSAIETKNGKMLCAVLTTVGGLHMALSESQPVLGRIDLPSFGWFSVQHTLGAALVVCGACCLKNCM